MAKKKPDVADTDPPEEARPDTTTTPLLVEDGKLLSPDVEFTAETLLRWLEGLADKKKKPQMRERAWKYVTAIVDAEYNTAQELLSITDSWWEKHGTLESHVDLIRASIGIDEPRTPLKANRFANPQGMTTPATSSMSGGSADSVVLSEVAKIMKESRESMADMQKSHEKAAAEQAKTAAELSIKAIQAVSASTAKIAVQPATLNCGSNGITPSPRDVIAWLEDIKGRYNAIQNGIRGFLVYILRDPTGSANDFKAKLTEVERTALYVCINEKIPRALLRSIWDPNDLDGAGLIHALLQHAIHPADTSLKIKRASKYFVDSNKALIRYQNFQAEYLELQMALIDVRWTVGTTTAELMVVIKNVFSNFPTVSISITDFWNASLKDQEAIDETLAMIPRYMDTYMEVNRLTADKDENEWKEVKKRERAKSDPSPYKPEGAPKAALRPPKPPQ